MAILPCAAWSQIEYDKPEQDGTRHVQTTEVFIRRGFTDTMPAYYAIRAVQDEDGIAWALTVHLNGAVPDKLDTGSLLIVRTVAGAVLESKNILSEYDTHDVLRKNVYGVYPFSEEDIRSMLTGIAKVRIEAPSELIDIEYDKKRSGKISKELTNRYRALKELLTEKKDIRNDF